VPVQLSARLIPGNITWLLPGSGYAVVTVREFMFCKFNFSKNCATYKSRPASWSEVPGSIPGCNMGIFL
jgi:hypothetical protein